MVVYKIHQHHVIQAVGKSVCAQMTCTLLSSLPLAVTASSQAIFAKSKTSLNFGIAGHAHIGSQMITVIHLARISQLSLKMNQLMYV